MAAKKRFSVYVTESQPDLSGQVSPCGEVLGGPFTESKLGARLQPQRKQKAPHELPVSSGSWEQNTLDSEAVKPEEQPFDDGKIFCVCQVHTPSIAQGLVVHGSALLARLRHLMRCQG